jgi:phosphatidate cytidylyltransferase
MSDKLKNFLIRTASGAVLLAVVLGAILWSKWSFGVLMLAIIIGGLREFYRMASKAGYQPQKFVGYATGTAIFIFAFSVMGSLMGEEKDLFTLAVILVPYVIMLIPMMFICELYRKSQTPIANIGSTLMGVIYIALPISLFVFIPILLGEGEWKPLAALFYIFIIWANDVFAYLFGITLGKHRLFERISPKKSWEGFIGGLLGAMAMGYLASVVMDGNHIEWIGLALIAAISGVFGDLVESLFKRSVDIKDSGHILPGHGGWLDRFDALILSIPFVFVYLTIYAFAAM